MSVSVEYLQSCDRCDRHIIYVKQWQWLCGDCEQLLGVGPSASPGFDLDLGISTARALRREVR